MKKSFTILLFILCSKVTIAQEGFIGEIRMFGGNFAPRNWAFCEGQLLSIAQNQALFSIIGTIYGGDGRTTFALPDLRGRSAVHPGNGPGLSFIREGQKGGSESVSLNIGHLPAHNHTGYINVADAEGTTYHAEGGFIADSSRVEYKQYTDSNTFNSKRINGVQTNNTGGNLPISIRSPYTGINYIICLYGLYPSRN